MATFSVPSRGRIPGTPWWNPVKRSLGTIVPLSRHSRMRCSTFCAREAKYSSISAVACRVLVGRIKGKDLPDLVADRRAARFRSFNHGVPHALQTLS